MAHTYRELVPQIQIRRGRNTGVWKRQRTGIQKEPSTSPTTTGGSRLSDTALDPMTDDKGAKVHYPQTPQPLIPGHDMDGYEAMEVDLPLLHPTDTPIDTPTDAVCRKRRLSLMTSTIHIDHKRLRRSYSPEDQKMKRKFGTMYQMPTNDAPT